MRPSEKLHRLQPETFSSFSNYSATSSLPTSRFCSSHNSWTASRSPSPSTSPRPRCAPAAPPTAASPVAPRTRTSRSGAFSWRSGARGSDTPFSCACQVVGSREYQLSFRSKRKHGDERRDADAPDATKAVTQAFDDRRVATKSDREEIKGIQQRHED